ncbi:hypothetical protein [Pseudanabaena sp. BC1403]|uniref:hypothetical protein n=1 Tax=Pseudanabaena sp. BC1403 TaxID=2043171 RepID=UPI000CD8AE8B|nr:hypothetical protein [Pseudanabaena sp. BC1403]
MTLFTNIWNADHEFADGNIEIANTLSSLRKAYIETLVTGLSDSLAYPILLGFLYQIDASAKRSKPYPIVSQRQTINLDLSECETFIFIPSNRLIDDYTLKLYVSTESGSGEIDLSAYALKTELPDLSNYVSASQLATALSDYALVSQLPDLSNYVTESSLATALADYVLTADLPSSSGSQNFIALSANAMLESNKKYLAILPDLVHVLPVSPIVGDDIKIATGNFSTKVFQNTSQTILNLATQTPSGSDTGLILKPYSSIQLIYIGDGLWITGFRSRTVNNWLPESVESTASIKSYTPTNLESYGYQGSDIVSKINDGDTSRGVTWSGGSTNGKFGLIATFADLVILSSINYWLGQFNGGYNTPSTVDIYLGNAIDSANLIQSFTFPNLQGSINLSNSASSSQYLFVFNNGSIYVSVNEIQLLGKSATGGEIVAV